jgi:hypothetical protein
MTIPFHILELNLKDKLDSQVGKGSGMIGYFCLALSFLLGENV